MGKHIEKKYHLVCEIVMKEDMTMEKIASIERPTKSFHKDFIY